MTTTCAYLIGSYMILCLNSSLADVASAFQPIADRLERFRIGIEPETAEELTILDCWEALHCGKVQGWLDFTSETPDLDRCIDMDEYVHYDNPANGKLHVIIPSRLIAFPCPSDLAADQVTGQAPQWVDIGRDRLIGPGYYADILLDFGVQLLVRCDASAPYDAAAFASRGMAVERLGGDLERRPERLLQEADRFLTLAQLAPGMIGMHGADAGLGRGGEMLVAALLIKRHDFRARAALAWLRITHPAAADQRVLRYSVLPTAASVPHRDLNGGRGADLHRLPAGCRLQVRRPCGGRGQAWLSHGVGGAGCLPGACWPAATEAGDGAGLPLPCAAVRTAVCGAEARTPPPRCSKPAWTSRDRLGWAVMLRLGPVSLEASIRNPGLGSAVSAQTKTRA